MLALPHTIATNSNNINIVIIITSSRNSISISSSSSGRSSSITAKKQYKIYIKYLQIITSICLN